MSDLALPFSSAPPATVESDRRRAAMAKWRRRSRMIDFFRRALPVAIGALLLGLVIAVVAAAVMGRSDEGEGQEDAIRMVNPRFYGRDSDGQAYVLSAREAVRDRSRSSRIVLTAPEIVMNSGDAARSTRVRAEAGVFDEGDKQLRLERNVRVDDRAGGFAFRTEEAVVDTERNTVQGSRPVQGVGPTGRIAADAYAVYDQGARITFKGNVRARLEDGAPVPVPQGDAP